MDWHAEIRSELARHGRRVDDDVVEEMAQRRLVRQLLVENAMLGVTGGAAGLWLTAVLLRALPALLPADFPRAETVQIDGRVFAFAAVLAVAARPVSAGSSPRGRWQSPRSFSLVECCWAAVSSTSGSSTADSTRRMS